MLENAFRCTRARVTTQVSFVCVAKSAAAIPMTLYVILQNICIEKEHVNSVYFSTSLKAYSYTNRL